MSLSWEAVAWITVLGLPSTVVAGAILWPQPREPHERSVASIQARIEAEHEDHGRE